MSRINLFKKTQKGFRVIVVYWEFGKVKKYELFKTFACAKNDVSKRSKNKAYILSTYQAALKWPETFGWLET